VATLVVIACGLYALKRHYAQSIEGDLRFVLAPTAALVSVVEGAHFELEPGIGYMCKERLFAIAKPCAGVNFMLAAWAVVGLAFSGRARDPKSAIGAVAASFVVAYVVAVFVNAVRIVLAMELAAHPFASSLWTPVRVHRVEGIVVYFVGLWMLHAVVSRRRVPT
jgi:exosortase K